MPPYCGARGCNAGSRERTALRGAAALSVRPPTDGLGQKMASARLSNAKPILSLGASAQKLQTLLLMPKRKQR